MTVIRFQIDQDHRSPIYRQLMDQVRYAISVGQLRPRATLPSIRAVEAECGVNRNTVRRAYMELEREGLITLRQGREAEVRAASLSIPRGGRMEAGVAQTGLGLALLQRAEAGGLDPIWLAQRLLETARAHDAEHPRLAFLECSVRQATYLARKAVQALDRAVIPLNLADLERDGEVLPPSVRFVLTPHWHVGDARALIAPESVGVIPIRVDLSAACATRLRGLSGRRVALIVRDAESAPGYRRIVEEQTGQPPARHLLLTEVSRQALEGEFALVATPPCFPAVVELAQPGAAIEELLFDPDAEGMQAVAARLLPDPVQRVTGV